MLDYPLMCYAMNVWNNVCKLILTYSYQFLNKVIQCNLIIFEGNKSLWWWEYFFFLYNLQKSDSFRLLKERNPPQHHNLLVPLNLRQSWICSCDSATNTDQCQPHNDVIHWGATGNCVEQHCDLWHVHRPDVEHVCVSFVIQQELSS